MSSMSLQNPEPRSGRRLAILGAPVDLGASQPGAVMGPAALRTAGLVQSLRELGHEVEDQGDLAAPAPVAADASLPHDKARNLAAIAAWSRLLSERSHAIARSGACPIVLGGDHSLSMGTVHGLSRHAEEAGRALSVLWLDAHADFNTPATSPSGNLHGMAAALLAGEPGLEAVFGHAARAAVRPTNLHLFGVRSVDGGERALLRARGVNVIDMRLIDEFGVGVLIRRVIEASRPPAASCMSASTSISSIRRRRPASARRCPAAPPCARRISSWRCCTIRGSSRPSTWSS